MRMNKREKMWKGEGEEIAGERQKKRRSKGGQDRYNLSVRCPEFWCTRCHPHDRAVCRGHLPHYGKCMHLGQALAGSPTEWAGKMAHLQLLLHYVSKLCTPWIATAESKQRATSWLPGLECLGSVACTSAQTGIRKAWLFYRWILDEAELQTSKSEPQVTLTLQKIHYLRVSLTEQELQVWDGLEKNACQERDSFMPVGPCFSVFLSDHSVQHAGTGQTDPNRELPSCPSQRLPPRHELRPSPCVWPDYH